MTSPPRISAAEWQVMEVLWERPGVGAAEVAAELPAELHWSETTLKTLLARLVKKGALRTVRQGRRYLYHPAVIREDCVQTEARTFADRVFGGAQSPMLAWFVQRTPLSHAEIEELEDLLRQKKEQADG